MRSKQTEDYVTRRDYNNTEVENGVYEDLDCSSKPDVSERGADASGGSPASASPRHFSVKVLIGSVLLTMLSSVTVTALVCVFVLGQGNSGDLVNNKTQTDMTSTSNLGVITPSSNRPTGATCKIHKEGQTENAASLQNGASCVASSEYSSEYDCSGALDGVLKGGSNNEWQTRLKGVGSWIEIQFATYYRFNYTRFIQIFDPEYQFKDILLTFSKDQNQHLTLTNFYESGTPGSWDEHKLHEVVSNYVRITALSVYTSVCNGFVEVEMYGTMCQQRNIANKTKTSNCIERSESMNFPTEIEIGCHTRYTSEECGALCRMNICCDIASYKSDINECCMYSKIAEKKSESELVIFKIT